MGILNITPDSFSDGGLYLDPDAALERSLRIQEEGAHLLDVGGESSKPGSRPISAKEEIRRLRPVLKRLAKSLQIPISVDTYKDEVAEMALEEGASFINDIYALHKKGRPHRILARRIARHKAGILLMHMQGRPDTMQKKPAYKNLMQEIAGFLKSSIRIALDSGVSGSSVVLDPGFGFGKTAPQNLQILKEFRFFSKLGYPLMAGVSRKSFLGHVTGEPVDKRLFGSVAGAAIAVMGGAHILRVHDVAAHKQACAVLDSFSTLET